MIDQIGIGVFGEVWTVRDTELDRTMAIRLPREGQLPVNFRRRNGRQMVLTCGGEERPAKPDRRVNSALVSAVAKAYRWQEQLESGRYASLEELAAANGVDRSYAGRILRLTSLSPEIVELVLDGNEPKGLTLAKLRKRLPLIWSEHRWD